MASLMVRVRRLVQSREIGIFSHRSFSSPPHPIPVTLIPGDGIGPEIADSVKQVFTTADVPITWEEQYMGEEIDPRTQSFLTRDNVESVKKNKFALKGPMTTPIGKGFRSLNLTMRKELNLYANVRPCFSLPGYKTKYDNVDLVTIRENTEGEYSGLEHVVVKGVVESLKIITRHASLRVAEYAFRYAKEHGRERVSAIHKANIMQKTDGLFLKCCKEVSEKYPEIKYEEVVIDNCCVMLVQDPSLFDVLVMPNLYGDIISDFCAGLIGGLGLTPSCNVGEGGIAVAEAVHGSAPFIAGQNKANPTALLLSGVMMLRHMDLHDKADRIQEAVFKTIAEGKYRTEDLGGMASQEEGVVEPSTTQCFAQDAMRIMKQHLDLISEMLEENDVAADDWTSVDFADRGSRSIVAPMQVKLQGPMTSQIRTSPRRITHYYVRKNGVYTKCPKSRR